MKEHFLSILIFTQNYIKNCFFEGNSIKSVLVVGKNGTFIQQVVTFENEKSCLIQVVVIYQLTGLNQPNQWVIE